MNPGWAMAAAFVSVLLFVGWVIKAANKVTPSPNK